MGKFVKFRHLIFELCERTVRQPIRHADCNTSHHFARRRKYLVTAQTMKTNSHSKLEGKYYLESTDPCESEIRAHLRP